MSLILGVLCSLRYEACERSCVWDRHPEKMGSFFHGSTGVAFVIERPISDTLVASETSRGKLRTLFVM